MKYPLLALALACAPAAAHAQPTAAASAPSARTAAVETPTGVTAEPEPEPAPAPPPADVDAAAMKAAAIAAAEAAEDETIEIVDRAPPGSQGVVNEETLARAEHDDIHKVLARVAGVYLRDEDGYGLRPNIGMRGAAAERSAKVALMEDGVLIAPAPYSAPAAYYFPLITRMSKVEVVKGPSAILYGPNTVGGAVNMIGSVMPATGEREAYVDAALGSDLYGKLHARAGERRARWGLMAEYVKLRSDGFKDLDGGGDTGFDKDEVTGWLRLTGSPTATVYHQVDLRAGYSREASDETYTGLTDDDFGGNPQRRYLGTALDHMDWDHVRLRADHRVELGMRRRLVTTAYRHDFARAWGKVDGFVGERDLAGVLAAPTAGSNALYYALLTGQVDSQAPEDELLLGTNDRTFVSQGVQVQYQAEESWGPTAHQLDAGVRLHFDRADRKRFEDAYRMSGGRLVRSERARATVLDSRAETLALSLHAQDKLQWGRVEVTAGVRGELLAATFDDHLGDRQAEHREAIVIPGGGVSVHVTDELSVLAGVHRGFVPAAPSLAEDPRPELSVNYEAGARWRSRALTADLIGFFSDYSNLKGTCTLSTGCSAMQDGDQFDGGRVHVWGVEAQAGAELALGGGWRAPVEATYTWTASRFAAGFSSDFAAWGDVMEGDELPYLPAHQVAVGGAIAAPRWELGTSVRWHGAVRDVAGQGEVPAGERADALLTVDVTAHVTLKKWAELYLTVDNLLDEQVVVSRRPYGARPNSPRLITGGYKARF